MVKRGRNGTPEEIKVTTRNILNSCIRKLTVFLCKQRKHIIYINNKTVTGKCQDMEAEVEQRERASTNVNVM